MRLQACTTMPGFPIAFLVYIKKRKKEEVQERDE
jgi:hypothetical protein